MRNPLLAVLGLMACVALAPDDIGAAPARSETAPTTFRGTANNRDASHTVDLQPGLVVVHGRHAGGRNFQLNLALPRPGRDVWREHEGPAIHLFNEIGQFNGGAAGRVRTAGTYVLLLFASGSYEITIEQPPLSQAAEPGQLEFSGEGHQVTPLVMVPAGARRITFTHDGQASYGPGGLAQVWLLDMDGNEVGGDVSGRLFNERGPFSGTVALEIIVEEPHIFHVDATGGWALRIE